MRRTILIPVLTMVLGALAGPASAGFNVCNKSNLAARVALGRFDGTQWTSEGWWTIQPKACAGVLTGPLQARYYYLYATDGAAGTWEGKTFFCVAPDARFRAAGRGNCAARGFDRRGFFEVDTGKNPNWTQSLSN
ncbi:MAG TPA: DUF1036 domain-containing protein [Rhizomicrobium sp.]|jgi:uncharacterized membrane protein|nr:DUF1036 domain-containing protein [Rhizomicrobium sp.]